MKRVIVIGAGGMLGGAMMGVLREYGCEAIGYDLPEVDIREMERMVVDDGEWVVNCAAWTAVDKAEDEATAAFEVNAVGAGKVARMCCERGMRLLHVSTDYVFDGKGGVEYREGYRTSPVNMYGLSKRMGEVLAYKELPGVLIVRTQSLYGDGGPNFVKAIMKQVEAGKKELSVVGDQVSCPTNVEHLAKAMVGVMDVGVSGMLHISAEGECSWNEFARAILEEKGIKDVEVKVVKTGEYPVKAVRPLYSVLSKARFNELTGGKMPTWREGLKAYLSKS
jgi:dTDP-4-dehydrorhamnose reductase